MAESTWLAKWSSPLDANRSKSEAASTGAGTPMSTAALTVQRPSPESDTLPASPSSWGLAYRAAAVRSSSQEENHRTAAPQFRDLAGVDVELVVLRLFQWCHLGGVLGGADAGIGVVQDVEALREGRHDAVLDAVVHHLHEVACARRTAVQIALLLRREITVATRGSGDFTGAWRNRLQDRVDDLDRIVIATNHEAVPTLQPEDPTAGTDVDIVNALLAQLGGPADVIAIVRVAAVDDDVALVEDVGQLLDDFAGDPGRDHHPRDPGLAELVDELLHGDRAGRALTFQLRYEVPIDVEHNTFVPVAHQPANDVRAHSAQPDHSQLHGTSLRRKSVKNITERNLRPIGLAAAPSPTSASVGKGAPGPLCTTSEVRHAFRLTERGRREELKARPSASGEIKRASA